MVAGDDGRRARGTFPSWLPLFCLDHVWIGRALTADAVTVPRDPVARVASDHLPIVVDLTLANEVAPRADQEAP